MKSQSLSICLWFEKEAEEAVNYYTSIFKNSEVGSVSRFGEEGKEFHKMPVDAVMSMNFRVNNIEFLALNSRSKFQFNDSISIMVNCDTQEEIDHYWDALTKEGEEGVCGWLKDKYGVSWQILPTILSQFLADNDASKSQKVMNACMQMKKFDIKTLQQAYNQ
ncbi:MAG: VOC family protein [bacterium]